MYIPRSQCALYVNRAQRETTGDKQWNGFNKGKERQEYLFGPWKPKVLGPQFVRTPPDLHTHDRIDRRGRGI